MEPLCSVSWTRNGSPLEGNSWAFSSCSLEVQLATLSVVCTSNHFSSCPSNYETRNTSNSSEVDHQSTYQQLYYICVFLLADEDNIHVVKSAVADLAGRWRDFGDSLGIRSGDLDAILSSSAHSPSDCLRTVLTLWLKQNYKVWSSHIPGLSTFVLLTPLSGLVTRGQIKFKSPSTSTNLRS